MTNYFCYAKVGMNSFNLTFALRRFVIWNMLLTGVGFLIASCQQDYYTKTTGV